MTQAHDTGTVLRVLSNPEELRRFGPITCVSIREEGGEKAEQALAQIDTAASHSCIGERMLALLAPRVVGLIRTHHAGYEPNEFPVHRCVIAFENGTQIASDFTALPSLSPAYDVLIGRDILSRCRFLVDFAAGSWELHFGSETP